MKISEITVEDGAKYPERITISFTREAFEGLNKAAKIVAGAKHQRTIPKIIRDLVDEFLDENRNELGDLAG